MDPVQIAQLTYVLLLAIKEVSKLSETIASANNLPAPEPLPTEFDSILALARSKAEKTTTP